MSRYTPHTWVNGRSPALNATNLNEMEAGLASIYGISGILFGESGNLGSKSIDSAPSAGSQNLISSGAVAAAIVTLNQLIAGLQDQLGDVVFTVTPEGLLNVSLKEE